TSAFCARSGLKYARSFWSGLLLELILPGRERKADFGAAAELTVDPDAAAVRFDDALHDHQPETEALTASVFLVGLPVAIEDVRRIFRRKANPAVCNRENHLIHF